MTASDLESALGLIGQSIALLHTGQAPQALRCLDDALALIPDFPSALVKRGNLLQTLARYDDAIADFERCLTLRPDMVHVRAMRDAALQLALEKLDADSAQGAARTQVCCLQAGILERLQRDTEALALYQRALEIDAYHIGALTGMGNLLLRMQRHDEALRCYEHILSFAPDDAVTLFNRGNVLQQNGRYHEALNCYEDALIESPGLPEALIEQAHCYLALGELEIGWRLYEARWDTAQLRGTKLQTHAPMWHGERLASDAVLLLWAEQGLGDTLQFVRYLAVPSQLAACVVVRVPVSLKTLIAAVTAASGSIIRVIGNDEPVPPHDVHCPLMSLPLACVAVEHQIPARVPYLQTPQSSAAKWQARLGMRSKPRIGLVWAGGQRLLNNPTRDMRAELLRPLLECDAEWIALQQSISEDDSRALQQMPPCACLGDELTDFADTAGLIAHLDMIVSIDSSVAHLAGALGKPVCLMLRKSGEWRWMSERNDTPWYPSHRLFRQRRHGEWDEVVRQVVQHLKETMFDAVHD